ncbi:MAG: hypothetical protein A2638_01735 [Nitrospirae bacterium RIFCSPHIGHO2_01_FULL_66_17]|nr:MAG: hypothetical protein A2638_01735 [Nitrospirae bacterium RIFCSPHIGHO2_01_FULL_66_17]
MPGILLALAVGLGACGDQTEPAPSTNRYVPDQILVLFRDDVTREQIDMLNDQIGAAVLSKSPYTNNYLLSLPSYVSVTEAQSFYRASDLVVVALPNYYFDLASSLSFIGVRSFIGVSP